MKNVLGNKFLILVVDTNVGFESKIIGTHPNVKVMHSHADFKAPFAPTVKNVFENTISAMRTALEYRKEFNWDFIVKIEDSTIVDVESLIRLHIDDRIDICSRFEQDGSMAGTFYVIGPRVVDVLARISTPITITNDMNITKSLKVLNNCTIEEQNSMVEERVWFWSTCSKTIPFNRIVCPSFFANKLNDTDDVRISTLKNSGLSVFAIVENPPALMESIIRKTRCINEGNGRIRISTWCPAGETIHLKSLLGGIQQCFCPTMDRTLVVYTDVVETAPLASQLPSTQTLHVEIVGGVKSSHSIWYHEEEKIKTLDIDWICHMSPRTMFLKRVDPKELLPTPMNGNFCSTGVFLSNGQISRFKDLVSLGAMTSTCIQTMRNTINPSSPSLSSSFFIEGIENGRSRFIDKTKCLIREHYQMSHRVPTTFQMVNLYGNTLNGYMIVLNPTIYGMEIIGNKTDVTNCKFVMNSTTPTNKQDEPNDSLLVVVGSIPNSTVAEQICEYSWFRKMNSEYPNVQMAAGPHFIWEVFADHVCKYLHRSPSLPSYSKRNALECGCPKGRKYAEGIMDLVDVDKVAPEFISKESNSTLCLINKISSLAETSITFEEVSQNTGKNALNIAIFEHEPTQIGNESNFTISMANQKPGEQLSFLNFFSGMKDIGKCDSSPSRAVIIALKHA